jgi:hypothetical protein
MMKLGYKVVRPWRDYFISCRVHRMRSWYKDWEHQYNLHEITVARTTPLLVFKTLDAAKIFANNEGGETCRIGQEQEVIFLCLYTLGEKFPTFDKWDTWPVGTDFATAVCPLKVIKCDEETLSE